MNQNQFDTFASVQSQLVNISQQLQQLQPTTYDFPGNKTMLQNNIRAASTAVNMAVSEIGKSLGSRPR